MELRTVGGRLQAGSTFKLVATGFFIGGVVIFLPFFALVSLITFGSGAPMLVNGEVVEGGGAMALLPIVMVPFILAMQAVMFGGVVVLGLWLFQKRWPLRVVAEEAAPPPAA